MNWDRNAKKICKFVKEHYGPWNNSPILNLRRYFKWYFDRGLLSVVWYGRRVAGVGTVRFFYSIEHYRTEFVNFEDGPLARCNLYGAIHPLFIPQVVGKMAKGRNPDKAYMWHRDIEELGPPRVYSLLQLKRLMLLLTRKYEQRIATHTS